MREGKGVSYCTEDFTSLRPPPFVEEEDGVNEKWSEGQEKNMEQGDYSPEVKLVYIMEDPHYYSGGIIQNLCDRGRYGSREAKWLC